MQDDVYVMCLLFDQELEHVLMEQKEGMCLDGITGKISLSAMKDTESWAEEIITKKAKPKGYTGLTWAGTLITPNGCPKGGNGNTVLFVYAAVLESPYPFMESNQKLVMESVTELFGIKKNCVDKGWDVSYFIEKALMRLKGK